MDGSNTIRRARRRDRFEVIDKKLLLDPEISHRARGLACWLLGKPDDWSVYARYLHNYTKEGRDACITAFRELIENGYVTREAVPSPDGPPRYQYVVHEVKQASMHLDTLSSGPKPENPASAPKPEKPGPGNPDPGIPAPENPALQNTEETENRKQRETEKSGGTHPAVISLRRILNNYALPAHSDEYVKEWGRMVSAILETKDPDIIYRSMQWIVPRALADNPDMQWARDARPWIVKNADDIKKAIKKVKATNVQ